MFHPSNIDCRFRTLIGDGFCQDSNNNHHCSFDGGDCCGPCVNREFCTECKCKTGNTDKITNARVGNGFCNAETNIKSCNFDEGDCCGTCVNSKYCHEGEFVKKQQCKKATRVKRFNSYSGQRWKLDNNKKLDNKKLVWKSDDLWIFKPKDDDLIYIENTSKAKVFGATSDGKVILEDFEEDKAHQLWKKGELDPEDYFTLENSGVPKLLTAISESSLEIKGNITKR